MRIGYGKIGRSMPLSLDGCGNLGGDVEMAAVLGELARAHPNDTFVIIGRNSGERPEDVGLPSNVENPWITWNPIRQRELKRIRSEKIDSAAGLTIDDQLKIVKLFDEMTMPTFLGLDQIILWVGQHGTTNSPLPRVGDRGALTKPQDWSLYYASFLLRGVNAWRDIDPLNREEIYLNSDPRNNHKMRDLKWPLRRPVLAQHTFVNNLKHERYGDDMHLFYELGMELGHTDNGAVWTSKVQNEYARLEINSLMPGTPFGDLIEYNETFWDRSNFGIFINETRTYVKHARLDAMIEWVLPLEPEWIHGTWSVISEQELGGKITPLPPTQYFPKMSSTRCTFTTPASGTGWATAKPWEAFAAGTICFFHPQYDTQNNILRDAPKGLSEWLRVKTPAQLRGRINALEESPTTWLWLVRAQREHFENAVKERRYIKMIEERLYGE